MSTSQQSRGASSPRRQSSSTRSERTSPQQAPGSAGPIRVGLAAAAVLSCVPYLVLKTAWIAGSDIGINDPEFLHSPVMTAANTITAAMMLIGALLAVALVRPIGWRLPTPLVALPMAGGIGLLGGVLVTLPIQAVVHLLGPDRQPPPADLVPPIQDWVYLMVYSGFVLLGLTLLALLADHAWRRWVRPGGWRRRLADTAPVVGSMRSVAIVLGLLTAVTAGVLAVTDPHPSELAYVIAASGIVVAISQVVLATRRPGRLRASTPLVLGYVAACIVMMWCAYSGLLHTFANPLVGDAYLPAGRPWLEYLAVLSAGGTLLLLPRMAPGRLSVPTDRQTGHS